jgi:hypothetical protein
LFILPLCDKTLWRPRRRRRIKSLCVFTSMILTEVHRTAMILTSQYLAPHDDNPILAPQLNHVALCRGSGKPTPDKATPFWWRGLRFKHSLSDYREILTMRCHVDNAMQCDAVSHITHSNCYVEVSHNMHAITATYVGPR